jgi:hypothetical protein
MTTIYKNQKTTRELRRRVPLECREGFTSVPDGIELITYRVELDPTELRIMARRAAASKGQQCRDGALLVVVEKRERQ